MGKGSKIEKRTMTYKTRKGFMGNKGKNLINVYNKSNVNIINNELENTRTTSVNVDTTDIQNGNTSTLNTSKSASFQKVEHIQHIQSPRKGNSLSGYRLIDLNILSQIFNVLLCPTCESDSLELHEDSNKKHGLSNLLFLKCSKCEYRNDFFTLSKVGRSFKVNKRIAHSMRSLGTGYTGMEKFNVLINIPPPMTKNVYELIANKFSSVAKEVAEGTMNDAVQDLRNKNFENNTDDIILDIGVSCDGTW